MRDYRKIMQGGRFKWYINPTDITDVAGTAEACLGLTRGANVNLGDQELRNIEADGQLGMVKGGQRITDAQPSIQLTLLEWDTEIIRGLKRFLIDESNSGQVEYRPKGKLEDIDYIDKLVGIGELVDGTIVRIVLENAILNQNPSFDLTDKDEAALPVTFMGTYGSADSKEVPITITFLDKATNAVYGAIAQGAIDGKTIQLAAATDIADEATLRASADAAVQALINAAVGDISAFPNAEFGFLLKDGVKTIGEVLQGSATDSFELSFNLDTLGFLAGDQTYQTAGTITIELT